MPKPNEYVKMLLTSNTIESKHPNCIISQWWNTNGKWKYVLACMSKQNSENFIRQDSQVNNCSMCPPWTSTTVFNLGRHWSVALLISCWSRLAQQVCILSLRSSKPTIGGAGYSCQLLNLFRTFAGPRVAFLAAYQLRYTLDILCCSDSLLPSTADLSRNQVRLVNFAEKIFNRTDRPILVRKLFTNAFSAHPFCWRTSLIHALSLYVKTHVYEQITSQWRYTVFPIVFPVQLGCFHLFYPITLLLKIFARNSHMLLGIDYVSTCVIHFKCTLLLKDIISWHVGLWGRFFMAHSVYPRVANFLQCICAKIMKIGWQ